VIGAARRIVATEASAPVSPTGRPPAPRTAGQHRDDHVERLRVGHPQPVHLLLGDPGGRQRGVNLPPAAVYHHQRCAFGERGNPPGDALEILRLLEQLAAELQDDHRLSRRHRV
jgi:hypothetical protein